MSKSEYKRFVYNEFSGKLEEAETDDLDELEETFDEELEDESLEEYDGEYDESDYYRHLQEVFNERNNYDLDEEEEALTEEEYRRTYKLATNRSVEADALDCLFNYKNLSKTAKKAVIAVMIASSALTLGTEFFVKEVVKTQKENKAHRNAIHQVLDANDFVSRYEHLSFEGNVQNITYNNEGIAAKLLEVCLNDENAYDLNIHLYCVLSQYKVNQQRQMTELLRSLSPLLTAKIEKNPNRYSDSFKTIATCETYKDFLFKSGFAVYNQDGKIDYDASGRRFGEGVVQIMLRYNKLEASKENTDKMKAELEEYLSEFNTIGLEENYYSRKGLFH